MNKGLEDLVDLMFDTNMEEVMKEKSTLEYIHKLQQENKQLKKELEEEHNKALKMHMAYEYYYSILRDLEEWLKEIANEEIDLGCNCIGKCESINIDVIQNKIQELKEKYK